MTSEGPMIMDAQYPGFVNPYPQTYALSAASRTRVRVPVNQPGTYTHNRSGGMYRAIWDLNDAERFLDTRSLEITGKFNPLFYKDAAKTIPYDNGTGPVLDQDTQALVARLTIGNAQGLIIEDMLQYNLWTNAVQSYTETPSHKEFAPYQLGTTNYRVSTSQDLFHLEHGDDPDANVPLSSYLTDPINNTADTAGNRYPGTGFSRVTTPSTSQKTGQVSDSITTYQSSRDFIIKLKNSSWLNRNRYLPMFVMRNGLRITLEFEDPVYAFYSNFTGNLRRGPQYSYVQIDPAITSDFLEFDTGEFTVVGNSTNPLVQYPNLALSAQGARKLQLVPGDRIAFRFACGSTNATFADAAINGSDSYVTGFATVIAVVPSTPNRDPMEAGARVTLNLNPFGRYPTAANVTTGTWVAGDGTHVLATSDVANARGAKNMTLVGVIVEKTFVPYISSNSTGADNTYNSSVYQTKMNSSIVPTPPIFNKHYSSNNTTASVTFFPSWDYTITDLEINCDFVKPAVSVYADYVKKFESPVGIPYMYTRLLYYSYMDQTGSAKVLKVPIQFSVRSLRGLIVAITDPYATSKSSDGTSYNLPCKSSFMTRGLKDVQLFAGGATFPARPIDVSGGQMKLLQINELDSLLGTLGNVQYTPQFLPTKLKNSSREYSTYGNFDIGSQTEYRDTSRFVIGLNTSKIDGDFAGGIDLSSNVPMNLQLTFDSHVTARPRQIHVWGLADALCTVQSSGVLTRY